LHLYLEFVNYIISPKWWRTRECTKPVSPGKEAFAFAFPLALPFGSLSCTGIASPFAVGLMRLPPTSDALVDFLPFVRVPTAFVDLVAARFVDLCLALDLASEFASSTTPVNVPSSSPASGGTLDLGGLPRRFWLGFWSASSVPMR